MSVADWTGALAAVAAAVATALAWRAASRSADATEISADAAKTSAVAAETSARAAETLARIERRRLHREMTPQIQVEATLMNRTGPHVWLTVRWDEPADFDQLDAVRVAVCDNEPWRATAPPRSATQADIDATIWAPYRFNTKAKGVDETGRTVAEFPLARGKPKRLQMEPTLPAPWMKRPTDWQEESFQGQPILLEFMCVREGEPPWVVHAVAQSPDESAPGPDTVGHG